MSLIQGRRSFVSVLASLAGFAIADSPEEAAAQGAAPPDGGWDLTWLDRLKGQHKQVYDLGGHNLTDDLRVLRFPRNLLDTFHDVFKLQASDISTIVGISGHAFPINASDRLWAKYGLGERANLNDPATGKPAVRNIFLDDPEIGVKALQARGTMFWQCNIALTNRARELAEAFHLPPAEVRSDLIAGLNPGVHLMPSHVMSLVLAQERGFTYMRP